MGSYLVDVTLCAFHSLLRFVFCFFYGAQLEGITLLIHIMTTMNGQNC
jgi:hypothetical protein